MHNGSDGLHESNAKPELSRLQSWRPGLGGKVFESVESSVFYVFGWVFFYQLWTYNILKLFNEKNKFLHYIIIWMFSVLPNELHILLFDPSWRTECWAVVGHVQLAPSVVYFNGLFLYLFICRLKIKWLPVKTCKIFRHFITLTFSVL